MNYLVMETHPAYAVLLDQEGRYLKAANLRYTVGDTVEDIVPLRPPAAKVPGLARPLAQLAALAACCCLAFFGYYTPNYTAYGTLRIQINPDVEMTISQTERVLELEGLNSDGMDLIAGYSFAGKSRDTATGELVDRAIEMGYLSGGDTISITVNSQDAQWQSREETQVRQMLEDRYGQRVVIRLGPPESEPPAPPPTPPQDDIQVIIPVAPPPSQAPAHSAPQSPPPQTPPPPRTPPPASSTPPDGFPDYDDTDYGPNSDGVTDYNDTDYGPYHDGVTDYDDGNVNGDDDGDDNDASDGQDDDNRDGDDNNGDDDRDNNDGDDGGDWDG